jgi:hypothetical protein
MNGEHLLPVNNPDIDHEAEQEGLVVSDDLCCSEDLCVVGDDETER